MMNVMRGWIRSLLHRPSKDEWAFIVALAVSTRGECSRRKVGAIVIDASGRLAGAGYNGSWPSGPSCLAGQCPRGISGVEPGSSYDTGPGTCHAIHAEMNAVMDVSDRSRLTGAQLYITTEPCEGCLKILRGTKITEIHWLNDEGVQRSTPWPFVAHEEQR